ncbi:MAG: biotin--[acetyl-CoA-carboxylase] ligase [Holosporales bacterium]|jgi:BirA family biotin operon repressor/biotin-[acetyl-CoA-carboxylase] ligase|nr:biotin--[acetyl-CoA-carboxylase] ligase [Holosporales bacterium]
MNLQIRHFQTVDSTNDVALEIIANANIVSDLAILADVQTSGRGRINDRVWISVAGNFHCTYIINMEHLQVHEKDAASLNHIVVEKLVTFLKKLTNSDDISMKLPNDILINGKKAAGTLIEIFYPYAVVGIGINLAASPLETATNLKDEFGISLKPADLVENLYKSLCLMARI